MTPEEYRQLRDHINSTRSIGQMHLAEADRLEAKMKADNDQQPHAVFTVETTGLYSCDGCSKQVLQGKPYVSGTSYLELCFDCVQELYGTMQLYLKGQEK